MASGKTSEDNKAAVSTQASVHLDAAVFGAMVQLPAFDKVEAETWFAVADANFALRKVTDSTTKYYYVLSKLNASTLRKLSSFIKKPRGSDPYREIKEELCEAYQPRLEQKLDALLSLAGMGDESPKEYGMEIKHLVSDATLDDMCKRIFVRGLPRQIVKAITGSLGGDFTAVITAANKAWTAAAATDSQAASVSVVSRQSAASVSAVAKKSTPFPRRGGRGGRQGQRGSRSGAQMSTLTLCSFHKKFGDSARRCASGCSRWGEERPRETQVFHVEESLDGEDTQQDTASGNE